MKDYHRINLLYNRNYQKIGKKATWLPMKNIMSLITNKNYDGKFL
jgi:hypothetical protein